VTPLLTRTRSRSRSDRRRAEFQLRALVSKKVPGFAHVFGSCPHCQVFLTRERARKKLIATLELATCPPNHRHDSQTVILVPPVRKIRVAIA
jgi:hypothetical protein